MSLMILMRITMTKRGPGRPALPREQKKKTYSIVLSDEEHNIVLKWFERWDTDEKYLSESSVVGRILRKFDNMMQEMKEVS
jgi:hypothetical protein